jgi:S1-C subfamily serine protease
LIKQFFFSLGLLTLAAVPSFAWDIDKMNEQIEKTNVIVSGVCSGTVIDVEERLVLTAHHCITDNLREIEKREIDPVTGDISSKKVVERVPLFIEVWKRQDYRVVSTEMHMAEIKGYDAKADIAILQITNKAWKPLMEAPMARDSYQYKRGLPVYAVGNPGVVFDNTLTTGIISAPARWINMGNGDVPYFQHSASATGGSSGGAVYNDSGELIGTISGGMRGVNVTLSVPISKTKELLKKIGLEKIYQ